MKLIRYMLLCNLILFISCNDADYKTLNNSAFINESRTSSSAKVIITDDGAQPKSLHASLQWQHTTASLNLW